MFVVTVFFRKSIDKSIQQIHRGNLRRTYFSWQTHEIRKTPDTSWLRGYEKTDGYKLLICHHPKYWELKQPKLKNHQIDLVLAGNAYGEQIRLGNRGLFTTGRGWFPKYNSGLHHGDHGSMVISRRLSNMMRLPRLFNPRDMVYEDIVPNWDLHGQNKNTRIPIVGGVE